MANPLTYHAYQTLADRYAELAPNKDYNAHYDRPAIMSLLGPVEGQNILDAGCGPGIYARILLDRGSRVTGIDFSERMLDHARRRTGENARFIQVDLEQPLTMFNNDEFDGILSALTVTYVKNLSPLFAEFYRVLAPNGWFVFSTEHPFFSYKHYNVVNYFETRPVSSNWHGFGAAPVAMHGYYHSLGSICSALTECGFVIERILEPKPTEEFRQQDPKGYEKRMRFPSFIHFRAGKISG